MQKFSGKITNVMPVVERGDWKSVQFRVEELEGQYPQSCVFTKSAKGDNQKYVVDFEKHNPVGSIIEVEYTFKSREYQGKHYTDITAYKTVNSTKQTNKTESVPQSKFNKVADANGGGSGKDDKTPGCMFDDDLPFNRKNSYSKHSIGK